MDSTFFHSSDPISNSRRVVMVLANAFGPDPRVEREACALVKHGYQVSGHYNLLGSRSPIAAA